MVSNRVKANFSFLIFLVINSCFFSQETQVYVLGSIHRNSIISPDSLYNFIVNYEPHVILVEADSSVFTNSEEFGLLKDRGKVNEKRAIQNYLFMDNEETIVLPFDQMGRKEHMYKRNGFFDRDREVYNKIRKLYKRGKLNAKSIETFLEYEKTREKLNQIENKGLIAFNSRECILLFDRLNTIETVGFLLIIEREIKLKKYRDQKVKDNLFWGSTHEKMIENILKYLKEYKGMRILIVVGNAHKYYIQTTLEKSEKEYQMKVIK